MGEYLSYTLILSCDNLRLEFKAELAGIKSTINDLQTSLNSTQQDVKDLEENVKKMTEDHKETSEVLKSKIAELESQLKEEVEHNVRLEQYTRRENLRFNYDNGIGRGGLQSLNEMSLWFS